MTSMDHSHVVFINNVTDRSSISVPSVIASLNIEVKVFLSFDSGLLLVISSTRITPKVIHIILSCQCTLGHNLSFLIDF